MDVSKLAFVIVEEGAEPDVLRVLRELGLEHYTRFADVPGHGETGRKEGTAIFPGLNTLLLVALPGAQVEPLVRRLHEVRDSFIVTPGLKIIVTDCVMY